MPVWSGKYRKELRMAAQSNTRPTIISRKQVEARTRLSRSSIYAKLRHNPKRPGDYDPTFPRPISLGKDSNGNNSCVGWIESEIDAWITAQIEASRKAA